MMAAASQTERTETPLLAVRNLSVEFRVSTAERVAGRSVLRAVDDVTFDLAAGDTLALVGESGCGKTTLARTLMRLYEPAAGTITVKGADLAGLRGAGLRTFRRSVQMIFQDPYASLNPRMRVEAIVAEPLRAQGVGSRRARRARVHELLDLVGLQSSSADQFPHAFSGGQRQRIGIARALALEPELLIADEPVSALDVSIQAQIVNLLKDLQEHLGLTLLIIAHDLAVVRQVASRVAVMYLGKLVEIAPRDAIFAEARHPYTQALLSAVPIPDPPVERSRQRITLTGEVPSPIDPPRGCRFHTRCPHAFSPCPSIEPVPELVGASTHRVACHLVHPPGASGP